jgi:hypothetical protein
LEEHDDERGIFVYPDVAKPKATSYAAIIDEFGEAGFWVPCVEPDELSAALGGAAPGTLEASMRELVGGLPPGALAQMQQALAKTDPATLARAAAELQGALAGNSGDLAGVLQRTMAQARDLLVAGGGLGGADEPEDDVSDVDGTTAEPARAMPKAPVIPSESEAPELWRQARAHVEAMRDKNPAEWLQFEKQLEQLAGAVPAAMPAPKGPTSPRGAAAGRPSEPGRSKKQKRR